MVETKIWRRFDVFRFRVFTSWLKANSSREIACAEDETYIKLLAMNTPKVSDCYCVGVWSNRASIVTCNVLNSVFSATCNVRCFYTVLQHC